MAPVPNSRHRIFDNLSWNISRYRNVLIICSYWANYCNRTHVKMTIEHHTSFTSEGDITTIFEMALDYFQTHGFNLENSRSPTHLVFDRPGSSLSFQVRSIPMRLYITLSKNDDGLTVIKFHFVAQVAGWADQTEYNKLNADVKVFENLVIKALGEE